MVTNGARLCLIPEPPQPRQTYSQSGAANPSGTDARSPRQPRSRVIGAGFLLWWGGGQHHELDSGSLLSLQPVGEFCDGQDGNLKLRLDCLNIAVATDQCIGLGYSCEHQKDDILGITNLR
ncbi:hypothetical protein Thiowin_03393 [Thiorhodovibrio winogradskyi]|uniref:Uncharacterized protein n=1 Tax=Thiorhodovibrio winogradskyi TaxID=77007 RepID=A0ABZ0SBC5_9GAMM